MVHLRARVAVRKLRKRAENQRESRLDGRETERNENGALVGGRAAHEGERAVVARRHHHVAARVEQAHRELVA